MKFNHHNAAFTLLELLVVMIIMASLAGILIPALLGAADANEIKSTQAVVDTVATTIDKDKSVNGGLLLTLNDGSLRYKWDFDRDTEHKIDGYPEKVFEEPHRSDAQQVNTKAGSYRGFYGTLGGNFNQRNLNIETGEMIDAWGHTLRIEFDKERFGSAGFGVYSIGPDGNPNTDDDIISWGGK